MRLVLDWDGTVTETDGFVLAVMEFGDPEVYRETERSLGRRLTLNEVLSVELETLRVPLEQVVAFLVANLSVRPGFGELVQRHNPLILSSGFRELIEPLLAREGVEVELVANSVVVDDDGWRAVFRDERRCPVCGEACKRASLPAGDVVFAGDGYSDFCAARAAARVFARDRLCDYLDEVGAPWEPFGDLHDVLRALG